jgi:hypothetical protein
METIEKQNLCGWVSGLFIRPASKKHRPGLVEISLTDPAVSCPDL